MDFDDLIAENDITLESEIFESDLISIDQILPDHLHIIPIRYRPIFPGIITPLIISQGRFTDSIDKVFNDSKTIGLVLIKDDNKDEINSKDLYSFGTAAKILKRMNLPDGGINVLINSIKRFKIKKITSEKKHLIANVDYCDDKAGDMNDIELKALTREVLSQLKRVSENNPLFTEEMKLTMLNVDEPGKIADFVTSILNIEKKQYQDILVTINVKRRLEKVLRLLHKEMEVVAIQKRLQKSINEKIDKQQKDFFLREQLKAIKNELGFEEDDKAKESRNMKKKVIDLELKGEVKEKTEYEIDKLMLLEPSSSEYSVTKNYIDVILSLPWNKKTSDNIDLDKAERILNKDHYGLEDVKQRILEFLAVKKLKADSKGSIICLVGPPGVGKTSLGKSIAKALNRKFFRLSLGGMRDEAEIKGHRRTYIGAISGKIIQGLKICKTQNPVFMLDEIDKLGQSYQGDPASALLEVLDPEQNIEFRDHYLDLPFDLSQVLFITTANTLDTIPQVLLDRMEIIRLSGYISAEKYEIGRRYLLPKQLKNHGLPKGSVKLNKQGFMYIINGWARESGVRNLERNIEKICRKSAMALAKNKKLPKDPLSIKTLRDHLGPEAFTDDELLQIKSPGLAIGLAWTAFGGATLVIESIKNSNPAKAELKLTGQLGDIMIESANIAYSLIQNLLFSNMDKENLFSKSLIHIHVPAGATPKDGPSAGITIACSLYSMMTGLIIKPGLAMTGELTLTGRVFPVGGIKEKIIAAKRGHLKEIIIPKENKKDLEEIPGYIHKGLKIHLVETIEDVLNLSFPKKTNKKQ